jgi:hypothetical protein
VSVRTSHRGCTPPLRTTAAAPLDVLAGGSERDGAGARWLAARRPLACGLALAVAAGGVLLGRQPPDGASGRAADGAAVGVGGTAGPVADDVRLALHPRAVVVPRHQPPAPSAAAVAGLHLELLNTGTSAVELRSVSLVPGRWQVEVADRHELRPGWSAVLDVRREVDCSAGDGTDDGPVPRELVVRVEVAGRSVVRTVDVGPGQEAYGGRLDDVLSAPRAACDLEAAVPLLGPIGDLFGPGSPQG